MRLRLMLLVALLQVLVLAYMAGEREWIIRYGTMIHLQTAPVDPQDPFRGSYVRLDYGIGRVHTNALRGHLTSPDGKVARGKKVYAVLKQADRGVAGLDYVTNEKPVSALFLRGRVDCYQGGVMVPVRYGLEAYFMQPDKAKALETLRSRDGEVQVPLEMAVAVAGDGTSVLKGYRWCELGIGLKLETVSPTNRQTQAATVKLVNVSSNNIAIVDLPLGRSLSLECDSLRSWGDRELVWVLAGKPRPAATDQDVVVLKPGEHHEIRVDLTQPDWFVGKAGITPLSLRDLPQWGTMYRLVYRPPTVAESRNLRHAAILWHGELPTRAFGGGRVD